MRESVTKGKMNLAGAVTPSPGKLLVYTHLQLVI